MTSPYRPDMVLECSQDWQPFDVLADRTAGAAFEAARSLVKDMCGRCPIEAACHQENEDEDWLKALKGREEGTCEQCGSTFVRAKTGPPRRYCNDRCRHAAQYAKKKAA